MNKPGAVVGVVLVSMCLSGVAAVADDWPQWRGPSRDGHSKETGLLKEWPKDGPRLVWQVKDLGGGYSTPSVAGGRVYVMTNKGLERRVRHGARHEGRRPVVVHPHWQGW